MPLPRVGLPEDSVAGYYAVAPALSTHLDSPTPPDEGQASGSAVRPPPARGRKTEISHRASKTPHHPGVTIRHG